MSWRPGLEKLVSALEVNSVLELPGVLDALRKEALPALRAATDTQKQLALLTSTVERIVALLGDLPGAASFAASPAAHPVRTSSAELSSATRDVGSHAQSWVIPAPEGHSAVSMSRAGKRCRTPMVGFQSITALWKSTAVY